MEHDVSVKALERETVAILETMSHEMNMHILRLMAYMVHKAVKKIYSEILIHDEDLKMVCNPRLIL